MLTEVQKDAIREQVRSSKAKFYADLAPFHLAKFCPLIKGECEGPTCMFFLPMGDGTKITGGACSIPLLASQAGPIADGLAQLATQAAQSAGAAPRVLPTPAGLIK